MILKTLQRNIDGRQKTHIRNLGFLTNTGIQPIYDKSGQNAFQFEGFDAFDTQTRFVILDRL
jgi:hypothetical protein